MNDIRRYNASNITLEDLFVNLGHDKRDLVVGCRWKNKACGLDDFVPVLTDHGLCYTFSPTSSEMVISSPGIKSGLQLMLNIEQYEYMNGPHDSAGVKVLLHDPRQTPIVGNLGQAVSTGVSTFAGINLLMIEYQPPPYSDCGTKPLNNTRFYTAEECYLDCLTTELIEKCGCRDIFMTSDGSGFPPACNLEQYFSCMTDANVDFYEVFERRCDCPVSCKVTLFDPSFSDGSLSNHAVDSLLTSNLSASLYKKLLKATEIKAKMDKRKQEEFRLLWETLNEKYTQFNDLLRVLPEYLENISAIVKQAKDEIDDIYDYLMWMTKYEKYVLNYGILFGKDTVSNYLSESINEFSHLWFHRLECLREISYTQNPFREALYNQTVYDLNLRKYLISTAKDDITSLFHSFREGVVSNDILFEAMNITNINYFVPKSKMKTVVSFGDYRPFSDMYMYCEEEIIYLYRNMSQVVDLLITLTETAFFNRTVDNSPSISSSVMAEYVDLTIKSKSCRDILNNMIFLRPIKLLDDEQEFYERQWERIVVSFYKASEAIYHLGKIVSHSTNAMNSTFKSFIDKTKEFVKTKQHSLTSVHSVLWSHDVQLAISSLKDFFFEVDTRGQTLFDLLWDSKGLTGTLWRFVGDPNDEVLDIYNKYFNNEIFLQNMSDAWLAYADRLIHARNGLDIRKMLNNIDEDLINAIDEIAQYLDNFNRSVIIDSIFLRENFLQLDIFYRQLSYEQISQQKAYDIFALICDIGGSMGLFIGASMLTVVEAIDLVLAQTPVFADKKKGKRKRSNTSLSSRL